MRRFFWPALAVLAPALLLGVTARALTVQPPWEPTARVRQIDAWLNNSAPDVLVVGPSIARGDIDAAVLGAALADPPLRVTRVAQPQASAPIWYTILRERVYAAGLAPKLVVVVATMHTLLTVRPPDARMPELTQHFAEPDSVILRKTLRTGLPAPLQRAIENRGTLRAPVLGWFRDAPVGLLFAGNAAAGGELVTAAGNAALGSQHGPRISRAIPVVEAGADENESDGVQAPAAESYLPDLAALVAAQGGRLAILLPPASTRRHVGFFIDAAAERAAVAEANRLGIAWIDLRRWSRSDADFSDGLHMTPEAAARFTADAAAELLAANAYGPGPVVPAAAPPPSATRTRTGEPPALTGVAEKLPAACGWRIPVPELAALGDESMRPLAYGLSSPARATEGGAPLIRAAVKEGACQGRYVHRSGGLLVSSTAEGAPAPTAELDAASTWIWPGGALTWAYDTRWEEAAAGVVEAELVVLGTGAAPSLTVGDQVVLAEGDTPRRRLQLPVQASSLPARVSVSAPPGVWVAVRSLRVRVGAATSVLVEAPTGARHDLVTAATFAPNPAPPVPTGPFSGGPKARRLPSPWVDHSGCSPVQVLDDEANLVPSTAAGAWILVYPSDGSDPHQNGRTYTLALREERLCRSENRRYPYTRTWMYGGDRFTAPVTVPLSGAPIATTRLQALPTSNPASGTLHVVVRVDGEVRLDVTRPVAEVTAETSLPLDPPILPVERRDVTAEATLSADAAPVLLSWYGLED